MSAAVYAFKLFESIEKRLDAIEAQLARLADAKDDRETAVELTADVKKSTADLQAAIPPGTPQP